ncbi:hypothetical protein ACJ72_08738, partial [Emergomyces africanus]
MSVIPSSASAPSLSPADVLYKCSKLSGLDFINLNNIDLSNLLICVYAKDYGYFSCSISDICLSDICNPPVSLTIIDIGKMIKLVLEDAATVGKDLSGCQFEVRTIELDAIKLRLLVIRISDTDTGDVDLGLTVQISTGGELDTQDFILSSVMIDSVSVVERIDSSDAFNDDNR